MRTNYLVSGHSVLFLPLLLFLFSCGNPAKQESGPGYLKDSLISTTDGTPRNKSVLPYPWKYYSAGQWMDSGMDSLSQVYDAANFKCFHAPIMYNYYFGYESYRFFWMRSFHRPVMITIKNERGYTVNTMILESHPEIWTEIIMPQKDPKKLSMNHMTLLDSVAAMREYPDADSIVLPRNNVKIALDTTIRITEAQWLAFKAGLKACDFWNMAPTEKSGVLLDGADWILEGQQQQQYHFVYRWSPKGDFAECCRYLIQLSAAHHEKVY